MSKKKIDIALDYELIIADLEAKLAESEKEKQNFLINYKYWRTECEQLKQQLAEKDKELKELRFQARNIFPLVENLEDKVNQDKISFAVEKLEEMRKFFLEEHRDEEMDTDYIITKDAGQIADYLLDQIKQLKEKNNG